MANTTSTAPRRKKGSGSIIVRHGKFEIRWKEDGKERQEATGIVATKKNRKLAEDLLENKTKFNALLTRDEQITLLLKERESLQDKITRLKTLADGKEALTLGGLVDAFRASPRRKDCGDKQLDRYCAQIAQFVEWVKDNKMEFAAVDDNMAERYAAELGKQSGSTFNKHLNTLTMAWKALGKVNGVKTNPWADIPRKRLEAHIRRTLTDAELKKILGKANGEVKDLIIIGMHTGLRLGDAVNVNWEDFKPDGTIEVVTGKTGAMVKLPSAKLLAALGRQEQTGKVLPDLAELYSRRYGPADIVKKINKVFAAAGVTTSVKEAGWSKARPDAGFHSLRHTFVSRCIEKGVPPPMVQALVGHASSTMTDHYTHLSAESILEAFRKAKL